jgi:hypothetical protein
MRYAGSAAFLAVAARTALTDPASRGFPDARRGNKNTGQIVKLFVKGQSAFSNAYAAWVGMSA